MAIVPTSNYVKFIRGTTAAFTALTNKDDNTLYFISDSTSSTSGKLYLGSKLISGDSSSGGGGSSVVNLTDLSDVVISTIGDKQLLIYNATSGKWENSSISTLVSVMTGATATTAGTSGLVPAPAVGAHNKFLRGDGTWVTLDIDEDLTNGILDQVETKINGLTTSVNNLITEVGQLDSTALSNRITALEVTVNGDDNTDGLVTIVNNLQDDIDAIHTAIDTGEVDPDTSQPITIIQKVTTLATSINNIDSRVSNVEASVKWSELTTD